jgi:hypothetical protein
VPPFLAFAAALLLFEACAIAALMPVAWLCAELPPAAIEVAVLEESASACALLPVSAQVPAVLNPLEVDSDTLLRLARASALEWSDAVALASLSLSAFDRATPKSDPCELATLVNLADALAEELNEAWAAVTLLLSAVVAQVSPLAASVSDWVPVQVMRACAGGARLLTNTQKTINPGHDRVSLR